jgi:hypothetical protein
VPERRFPIDQFDFAGFEAAISRVVNDEAASEYGISCVDDDSSQSEFGAMSLSAWDSVGIADVIKTGVVWEEDEYHVVFAPFTAFPALKREEEGSDKLWSWSAEDIKCADGGTWTLDLEAEGGDPTEPLWWSMRPDICQLGYATERDGTEVVFRPAVLVTELECDPESVWAVNGYPCRVEDSRVGILCERLYSFLDRFVGAAD